MKTITSNLPQIVTELNQWVGVSEEKVPINMLTGEAASSTNPYSWCSFEDASSSAEENGIDYLGFVFKDNGIVGIDIDTGFDEDGFLSDVAIDIISRCQSYTEKSRSGRGFHILLKGSLPFNGRNNRTGQEIYQTGRYFIMTGKTMFYNTVKENQEAIDYIVSTYFPETRSNNCQNQYGSKVYCPEWQKPENGRIKIRPNYPQITEGSRNLSLLSVAGSLRTAGYPKRAIYDELLYCNSVACEPPLPKNEIQQIVNSIMRYQR